MTRRGADQPTKGYRIASPSGMLINKLYPTREEAEAKAAAIPGAVVIEALAQTDRQRRAVDRALKSLFQ